MKCMTAERNLGADFWSSISKDAKSACGVLLRMRSYAISLAYTADERILGSDVRKMFSDEMKTVKIQDLTQEFEGLMFRRYQEISEEPQAIRWELQDALVRVAMQKKPKTSFPMVPEVHMQSAVDKVMVLTGVCLSQKYEQYRREESPDPLPAGSGINKNLVLSHGRNEDLHGCWCFHETHL